jgi:hypothetical protein
MRHGVAKVETRDRVKIDSSDDHKLGQSEGQCGRKINLRRKCPAPTQSVCEATLRPRPLLCIWSVDSIQEIIFEAVHESQCPVNLVLAWSIDQGPFRRYHYHGCGRLVTATIRNEERVLYGRGPLYKEYVRSSTRKASTNLMPTFLRVLVSKSALAGLFLRAKTFSARPVATNITPILSSVTDQSLSLRSTIPHKSIAFYRTKDGTLGS